MFVQRVLRPLRAIDSVKRLMSSTGVIVEKLTVTIPTRTPEGLKYEMPYIRTNPGGTTRIVGIHGTPRTLDDFRCLIDPLEKRIPNSDIIAMTLPDLNFSFRTDAFWHSAEEKKHLIVQFLESLQMKEIDIMIGHSAGVYPTLVTALYSPIKVKSVVLMCGLGSKIIPFCQPEWVHRNILLPLLRKRATRSAGLALGAVLKTLSGFGNMSAFNACSALQTQHATRYWDEQKCPIWIRDINKRDIPRLTFYGAKDKFITAEESAEFAKLLGSPSVQSHFIYDGLDDASAQLKQEGESGSRCPVVGFTDGGHFTHEQFPEITADHITRLIKIMP